MSRDTSSRDESYEALVSPFRSISSFTEAQHEELLREESEILDGTSFKILGSARYQRGTQVLSVGELTLIAGRTTPVQSTNTSELFSCFFAMPFMGGFVSRDGALCDEVKAGDIYLNQEYYATSAIGYLSSLFVALDRQRLERTMRSISGGSSLQALAPSVVVKGGNSTGKAAGARKMWSLISFIDQLHSEDQQLPSCLGLDEQFYRLLCLTLLESCGQSDDVKQRWQAPRPNWTNPLDELVDYIRINAHTNLTLTDLEERSHYSARHLQNLFKDKFDCTPMQFVRRERLAMAMQRLQMAEDAETVTSIARQCGYRFVSNFTADFQRQFGVNPSTVLRASRRGGESPASALTRTPAETPPGC